MAEAELRAPRAVSFAAIARGSELLVLEMVDRVTGDTLRCLPGGSIEFFETAADAVRRGLKEVSGLDLEAVRQIGVVESLVVASGVEEHEIVFLHAARLADTASHQEGGLVRIESNGAPLRLEWRTIAELRAAAFRPATALELADDVLLGKAPGPRVLPAERPDRHEGMPLAGEIRAIAVVAIRRGAGQYLLTEGVDPIRALTYLRPAGGGIDFGELSATAARREVREELGLELASVELLGVIESHFFLARNPGHEIVFVYEGTFADETLLTREKWSATESDGTDIPISWRSLDELHDRRILVPTGLQELLEGGNTKPAPGGAGH